MEVASIWIAYAFFFAAAYLGAKARSPRLHAVVLVASVLALASSVGAIFAPLVADGLPLYGLLIAWGVAGMATAALATSHLLRGRVLGRALSKEGRVSWSGGQSVAPSPPAEGFTYRAGGFLLLPVVFLQFCLATAPITVSLAGFAQVSIGAVALVVAVHSVVLGVLAQLCHQSLFAAAA